MSLIGLVLPQTLSTLNWRGGGKARNLVHQVGFWEEGSGSQPQGLGAMFEE